MVKENLYLNKKGFFVTEILVAVSICSLTSVLVVSANMRIRSSEETIETYRKENDTQLQAIYRGKDICDQ